MSIVADTRVPVSHTCHLPRKQQNFFCEKQLPCRLSFGSSCLIGLGGAPFSNIHAAILIFVPFGLLVSVSHISKEPETTEWPQRLLAGTKQLGLSFIAKLLIYLIALLAALEILERRELVYKIHYCYVHPGHRKFVLLIHAHTR